MQSRWLIAGAVLAQFLGTSEAVGQQQGTGSIADGDVIEEIVVTARKRVERLIDVPVSAAVLDSELQDALVIEQIDDYLRQVPNVLLISGGPPHLADVSIRGQGGGRVGFSESATGVYRNGIFIAGGGYGGRAHTRLDFFDNERVEVYRGPQGALYGRNAIGGAINVISRRPNLEAPGGYAEVSRDSVETTKLEAVANVPIVEDRFGLRVGGFYNDQADGFIEQVGTGEALDEARHVGARVSARYDANSDSSLNLVLEHRNDTTPGFGVLGFQPLLDPEPYKRDLDDTGDVDVEETQFFLDYQRDYEGFDLTVLANYRTRDASRDDEDLDHFLGWEPANPTSVFRAFASETEDFYRYGTEIRLTSSADATVRWLLGIDAQYYEDDVSTRNGALEAAGFVNLNDGRILPAGILANVIALDENFVEELTSYSAFGSVEWDLSERLTAAFELRVQRDSKDFTFLDRNSGLAFSLSEDWTPVLPVASLSYSLSETQLLFARAASGFRPGGFNSEGAQPGFEQLLTYDPEKIYSAEFGWKGSPTRALNFSATAFYSYTDDVQILTAEDITGTGRLSFILQNGGATEIWGIEAEMRSLTEAFGGQFLTIIGVGSTDGEFKDTQIQLVGSVVDLSGNRVNRTRDYSVSLSTVYNRPIGAGLEGFFSLSFQAEGGGSLNADGTSDNPDYERLDGRIGVRGERFSASVFSQNVTEEEHVLQRISGNEYYSDGRRVGVEFRYDF